MITEATTCDVDHYFLLKYSMEYTHQIDTRSLIYTREKREREREGEREREREPSPPPFTPAVLVKIISTGTLLSAKSLVIWVRHGHLELLLLKLLLLVLLLLELLLLEL